MLSSTISGFEPNPTVAIALSGGADSMALLLLTREWLEPHGGRIIALTVDHKLRAESTAEAAQVAKWVRDLGVEHHILTLSEAIVRNVQATARRLRYEALENWCKAHGVLHLFTGHHADDVEETLAMRMWRGSGTQGLAGIPQVRHSRHVRIIRPLLGLKKQALIHYLNANLMPWVEDASNESDDYERNAIRKQLVDYPLPENQAAHFAARMAIAKNAIENKIASLLAESVQFFADGSTLLDQRPWMGAPEQIALSAFSRIIMFLSGADTPVRGSELKQLLAQFREQETKVATLGGLLFERSQKQTQSHLWQVCREPSRVEAKDWNGDTEILWDRRFAISSASSPLKGKAMTIAPLGTAGLEQLKGERVQFPTHLSYAGKLGLLSIWQLDHLAAVPHISYWNTEKAPGLREQLNIQFAPAVSLTEPAHNYPNL